MDHSNDRPIGWSNGYLRLVGKPSPGRGDFECEYCGRRLQLQMHRVGSGHNTTCGDKNCAGYRRAVSKRAFKHGGARRAKRDGLYSTWQNIKARCANPNNPDYQNYGARGISMYEPWAEPQGFLLFRDYIVQTLGLRPDGMSLNRKNNDGNYEPENLEWATYQTQARQRRSVRLPFRSTSAVSRKTQCYRVRERGLTDEEAATQPLSEDLRRKLADLDDHILKWHGDGDIVVFPDGVIFERVNRRWVPAYSRRDGYVHVKLRGISIPLHRILALIFGKGHSEKRCFVDHINGRPWDNRIENLRWVSERENAGNRHAARDTVRAVRSSLPRVNESHWRAVFGDHFDAEDYPYSEQPPARLFPSDRFPQPIDSTVDAHLWDLMASCPTNCAETRDDEVYLQVPANDGKMMWRSFKELRGRDRVFVGCRCCGYQRSHFRIEYRDILSRHQKLPACSVCKSVKAINPKLDALRRPDPKTLEHRNGYNIPAGAHTKVWFRCSECGMPLPRATPVRKYSNAQLPRCETCRHRSWNFLRPKHPGDGPLGGRKTAVSAIGVVEPGMIGVTGPVSKG